MTAESTSKVAVLRSTYKNVNDNIKKMFELLEYTPVKKGVLIKANLVDSYPPKTGIITSPKIIEAIIKYLRKYSPDIEIVVGDGCALHTKMEIVFSKSGYQYLSDQYNVELVDLDEVERKEYKWEDGTIKLPEYLESYEYINVAKMKTHSQTSVSLCMKNQKGLLRKKDKKDFHRKCNLHESIRLLAEVARPDLNIIDGIIGLEGRGPIHLGKTKKDVNLIIGSKNIYAADNVAAKIMGFSVADIDHIPEFSEYTEVGEKVLDCITPFKKCDPSPWVDKNVYIHFDETTCSICPIVLEYALKPSLSNFAFATKLILSGGLLGRKDIIVANFDHIPKGAEDIICIGNCCLELSEKHGLHIVRGCPPEKEEIRSQYLEFCKSSKKTNSKRA
jgi:uncharacterized protein (DUF362 family)